MGRCSKHSHAEQGGVSSVEVSGFVSHVLASKRGHSSALHAAYPYLPVPLPSWAEACLESPVSHNPGHCVSVYSKLTAGADRKLQGAQINTCVNSKPLNLIRPISSGGTGFAVLLLGPSGRKWSGKFSP